MEKKAAGDQSVLADIAGARELVGTLEQDAKAAGAESEKKNDKTDKGKKPKRIQALNQRIAANRRKLAKLVEGIEKKVLSAQCDPVPEIRASSSELGENLRKGPYKDIDPSLVSNQPEAHHIVAGGAGSAKGSRIILAESPVCIGINDAVNGVWLPKTSGVNAPASSNLKGRVFHNKTFTEEYHLYVLRLLTPAAGNKRKVVGVLTAIRNDLTSGTIRW
jgi:hypothetical protein